MNVQPDKGKRSDVVPAEPPEHKPLTLRQNVMLTMKVLVAAALVIAAIAALDRFTGKTGTGRPSSPSSAVSPSSYNIDVSVAPDAFSAALARD